MIQALYIYKQLVTIPILQTNDKWALLLDEGKGKKAMTQLSQKKIFNVEMYRIREAFIFFGCCELMNTKLCQVLRQKMSKVKVCI